MNTTVTHVVEGTDLPSYESGLTDSGYLHMGRGVKFAIADRHVEYLRQLVVAAEGAIQRIEARAPKPGAVRTGSPSAQDVGCPQCDAAPGSQCTGPGSGWHLSRFDRLHDHIDTKAGA